MLCLEGRGLVDVCKSSSLPKNAGRLSLLPLYAGLPTENQMRIFEPAEPGTRKVILSTNIAEVSRKS